MSGMSKFIFVGHVAKITPLDKVTKVRAIANYGRKGSDGEWTEDPHAVTLTIFEDGKRNWVDRHLKVGDQIQAEGRIKDNSYQTREGDTRYETSLTTTMIERLSKGGRHEDDSI